ncbi:MAG: glycosyltransferase family 39 protein [Anaerolineae bacterium]
MNKARARRPTSIDWSRVLGSGWPRIITVWLCLGSAFVLRLLDLQAADLSFDEVATVFVARRPLVEVIRYVMSAAREHPPLYYLVTSAWMQLVGTTEFAIRYPSVLASILAVSWSWKLGRRLLGQLGGRWNALLCAVAPFAVWAGRNGRMYALMLLLALITMERWLQWARRPRWQNWLVFAAVSFLGAMTHYYLALLWPVQGLLLILLPRETRSIRRAWIVTVAGLGLAFGLFVAVSPGVRAMVLEIAARFPAMGFREEELSVLVTDLYLWGYQPQLVAASLIGVGLTAIGWALAWTRCRKAGAVLAIWALVPLLLLHAVPEKLASRYLALVFPAISLGLAALLSTLRIGLVQLAALGGLLWVSLWRLPVFYETPDTTFSNRMAILHAAARPGDALLMNGPWPSLLLTYYEPPEDLSIYAVPAAAPPGFNAEADIPRLEAILEAHDRLWVSYGAIHWADPQYSVSRWLAENAYCVFERAGMALYLAPSEQSTEVRGDSDLGSLRLEHLTVDRERASIGEGVQVGLSLQGARLDRSYGITLALLDATGTSWQHYDFQLGPVHQPSGEPLPTEWREQRGLWLLPGLPPGTYTLAFRIQGSGVDAEAVANSNGWIPIRPLEILPDTPEGSLLALLPNYAKAQALRLGEALEIAGLEPYGAEAMRGYPTGFRIWWHALEPEPAHSLSLQVTGTRTQEIGTFLLGPDIYPADHWQAGDVILQDLTFELPGDLPAGEYQMQAQILDGQGEVLTAIDGGDVEAPKTPTGWVDLYALEVEARQHRNYPPLLRTRRFVEFGDELRLRGFRLERRRLQAGEEARLTVYWEAVRAPDRTYAVFNHLRTPDGDGIWQQDSWPQAGVYTTDRWQAGEVVAESYTIELPSTVPTGTYTLYTGVYVPATGDRLPAVDRSGERYVNDELPLLELQVMP